MEKVEETTGITPNDDGAARADAAESVTASPDAEAAQSNGVAAPPNGVAARAGDGAAKKDDQVVLNVAGASPEIVMESGDSGEEVKLYLGDFAGPLDLLLYLIRQEQVDIYDIPIARITDEYLSHLRLMREMDIAVASEFLVMAAQLIEIKSRMLLPPDPLAAAEEDQEDPRRELVERLLEHEKYKAASQMLWSRATVERAIYQRAPIETDKSNPEVSVGVFDLLRVFQEILARKKEEVLLEIERDEVSMAEMLERLRNMILSAGELNLRIFFERAQSRRELVLAFLSVLELVRTTEIKLHQRETFGEIIARAARVKLSIEMSRRRKRTDTGNTAAAAAAEATAAEATAAEATAAEATPTNAAAEGGEAAAVARAQLSAEDAEDAGEAGGEPAEALEAPTEAPTESPAAGASAEGESAADNEDAGSFAEALTEAGGRPTEGDLLGPPSQSEPEVVFRGADAEEGEAEVVIHDADAEDRAEARAAGWGAAGTDAEDGGEVAPGGARSMAELMSVIEALIFVSEEPLPPKALAELLKEERGWVEVAVAELAKEFNERNGGLMMREVAGGWQIATRPEFHEHVRAYLKSRPSAKLSLAALETLAVIAYKQPITVPEILEIRGVQSSSAIKTLLEKRLIVAKGRKEVVGRPMLYGTSKEFLMQFGLKDLSELPNIEDFEDLAGGGA